LLWSQLYRYIYQRKYRSVPVERLGTPEEVQGRLNILRWRKDSFRELWDAVGSPHWVQHCINAVLCGHSQPAGALDCDEFAVWAAQSLAPTFEPVVMNVFWHTDTYTGHHVCLYRLNGLFYCLGNWGKMGPYPSTKAAAEAIVAKTDGSLVGWSTFTPGLKLISVCGKEAS